MLNGYTGENTVEQVKETTKSVVNGVTDSANATKDVLGGIGNMMSGLVNMIGSGIGAISNMFNNVGLGKISGLGIFGLIAAGYMMFGRSGILVEDRRSIDGYVHSQQYDRSQAKRTSRDSNHATGKYPRKSATISYAQIKFKI